MLHKISNEPIITEFPEIFSYIGVGGWHVFLQVSFGALTSIAQNLTTFGERAFKGFIRLELKLRSLGWAPIQSGWCLYRNRKLTIGDARGLWTQRKGHMRTQGGDGHLQVKETGLRRNQTC